MANDASVKTGLKPLFYVEHSMIFHRPVRSKTGTTMGFRVCVVCDGVDPERVCYLLNLGEQPKPDEPRGEG